MTCTDRTQSTENRPRAIPIAADQLPPKAFRASLMVRFSHCDPAGIVYTPRYVDMINGVIEDFFPSALALDYHEMIGVRRVGMGYVSVDCDFLRPGMMGDHVTFTVLIPHLGQSSLVYQIYCHKGQDEVMRSRLVAVTTSLETHKPINIPDDLKAALKVYQDKCLS